MARAKRHERTAARESALALLYSSDITEHSVADIVDAGQYPAEDIEFAPYAEALVRGVQAHIDDIDGFLESTSENWALDRMPVVDRAILRLAVYEMRYVDEVPVSVTINEAVELAKAYGGEDDSSRFVNGVLGRIAKKIEPEELSAESSDRLQNSNEPGDAEAPSVEGADSVQNSKVSADDVGVAFMDAPDSVQDAEKSFNGGEKPEESSAAVQAPAVDPDDFDAVAGELITEPFEGEAK